MLFLQLGASDLARRRDQVVPHQLWRKETGGAATSVATRCQIGTLECAIGDRRPDRVSACSPSGSSTSMSRVAVTIRPAWRRSPRTRAAAGRGETTGLAKAFLG